MTKKAASVFNIFIESLGLYFSNFGKFCKYMTFPVLGQILGLGFVFFMTYIYSANIDKLIEKYPNINNFSTLITISILITLPGLAIFCKAFWEYLVAYGAVNSMYENLSKSGKLYDLDAHTELIKRRTGSFIVLWLLFGIFSILAVFPPFWIICAVFAIYFVLVFQVFTFEPELSPIGCVRKSLVLIKGHFVQTFVLLALAGIITYMFIPQIFLKISDISGINKLFTNMVIPFVNIFPEINLEKFGFPAITGIDIAKMIVSTTIAQIVIQYTLPFRAILWSGWYKHLNNGFSDSFKPVTKSKKSTKRPSEKLMEQSNKKFSKKKLDSNILKRAMEKDEEE